MLPVLILFAFLLATVAGVLVDGGYVRRSVGCDLRNPRSCVVDLAAVTDSPIGLLGWETGRDLVVDLGPLAAGDRLKLTLCAPEGPQWIEVRVDGAAVGRVEAGSRWRRCELVIPRAGRLLRLGRVGPGGGTVHLSRLSATDSVAFSTGIFEATVVRRDAVVSRGEASRGAVRVTAALLGLVAALVLLELRRTSAWRAAVPAAMVMLWPVAAVAGALAALSTLSPYRLVLAPGSLVGAFAAPPLMSWLWRERSALRRGLRRLAPEGGVTGARGEGLAQRIEHDRALFATVVGVGLAVLAAGLVVLRPLTPFEWDEVLFLRALDGYDVSRHAPHPPGYPLYVASAWTPARLGLEPLLALQLVSLIGAVVAVVAPGAAMRRLGAGRRPVLLAGTLLAATPAFAVHATVGMSDALATGLAVLALWAAAGVAAGPRTNRHLVVLAIAAAAAAAARPQTLVLLALPGAWAVASRLRRRRWRATAVAVSAGAAVSVVCWLPAILLTGWARYWRAVEGARRWMAAAERGYRLPGAPLGLVADAWLVRPFGTPSLAVAFGLLVVLGAVAWWRAGRRGLVLLVAPAAVCYLVVAAFTMQLDTAVRYALPAMPCLAMLAAGVAYLEPRFLRRAAVALALATAVASAVWLAPTLARRAREPAPAWAALEWVRDHAPPGTTIVFDVGLKPHTQYVLGASGLRLVEAGSPPAARITGPAWHVRLDPGPGLAGEVLFEARWPAEPLASLTRHRYLAATVVAVGP